MERGVMGQQETYSLTVAATTGRWSWVLQHGEWRFSSFLPPSSLLLSFQEIQFRSTTKIPISQN